MIIRGSVLLLLCALSALGAADSHAPGRATPYDPAQSQAFYIAWGDAEAERSYVVIESGDGLRRPALVATVEKDTSKLRVSYAGTAYVDKQGRIHIDCQRSRIYGPERNNWSPDSFMVSADGKVKWMDDAMRNGGGRVLSWAPKDPKQHSNDVFKALPKKFTYRYMQLLSRWHLEGHL